MKFLILDCATTAIDSAEALLNDEPIEAPSNYKDPAKIADFIAGKRAERLTRAALDLDLARITCFGWSDDGDEPRVQVCKTEDDERIVLDAFTGILDEHGGVSLVGFNSLRFDWPLIMRRCAYLGLAIPAINLDRYRSHHLDLWEILSNRGTTPAHALSWYMRRLGHLDLVKPLTGAEEAQAAQQGRWDELRASVACDVQATIRLARWLHVLPAVAEAVI